MEPWFSFVRDSEEDNLEILPLSTVSFCLRTTTKVLKRFFKKDNSHLEQRLGCPISGFQKMGKNKLVIHIY